MGNTGITQTKKKGREATVRQGVSRIRMLSLLIFFIGLAVFGRLYFLQIISHDKWVALAETQHNASTELAADRGEIYIHDGENGRYPLAVNRDYKMVYVVPKDIVEKDTVALRLAQALGIDATVVRDKLNGPDDPFEIIKKHLSDDEVNRVTDLHLKGVGLLPEKYRYYPGGELASQVVGFASLGERGGAGGTNGVPTPHPAPLHRCRVQPEDPGHVRQTQPPRRNPGTPRHPQQQPEQRHTSH